MLTSIVLGWILYTLDAPTWVWGCFIVRCTFNFLEILIGFVKGS